MIFGFTQFFRILVLSCTLTKALLYYVVLYWNYAVKIVSIYILNYQSNFCLLKAHVWQILQSGNCVSIKKHTSPKDWAESTGWWVYSFWYLLTCKISTCCLLFIHAWENANLFMAQPTWHSNEQLALIIRFVKSKSKLRRRSSPLKYSVFYELVDIL